MIDLDELAAWLDSAGHAAFADDLRQAAPGDRAAVAYLIAADIEHDGGDQETLPAELRTWADQQERQ